MPKQLKNFRIKFTPSLGSSHDCSRPGWLFDKLCNAKHPFKEKYLGLKYVFSRVGSDTFLLNLKHRATLTFVILILKRPLGTHYGYSVEPVEIAVHGEKFVPGEREKEGRSRATIEREALTLAGDSSATFVLVNDSRKVAYSYDGHGGISRVLCESRHADVDAGSTANTPQVRCTHVSVRIF